MAINDRMHANIFFVDFNRLLINSTRSINFILTVIQSIGYIKFVQMFSEG